MFILIIFELFEKYGSSGNMQGRFANRPYEQTFLFSFPNSVWERENE